MFVFKNIIKGTKPVVVHNPGFKQNIALWEDIQNVFMRSPKLKIKCPSELSIITWNSRPNKGLFEKSLDRFDIPHTVLGKTSRWFGNKRKLVLSIKFLQECQTPYVMGVDCFDAIIVGNPQKVVDMFEASNAQLMYGMEPFFWPHCGIAKEWKEIEALHLGNGYINSGMWIGKVDFCLRFFTRCLQKQVLHLIQQGKLPRRYSLDNSKDSLCNLNDSDQVRVHWSYDEFKDFIVVDNNSEVFQNLTSCGPDFKFWVKYFL
jgi:hypothetical protein